MDAEIDLLFDGSQAALRQAGMTMDDLVWVQVHAPDVSLWQEFNSAYMKLFSRRVFCPRVLGIGYGFEKGTL